MILFRPVGVKELLLIMEAGGKGYPERLPFQPIFYPVLNQKYAGEIAAKWNTKDDNSGFAGFVTEFEIDDNFADRYERHIVGGSYHEELWVPAEELDDFNAHIAGTIRIAEAYYGAAYPADRRLFADLQVLTGEALAESVLAHWKTINLDYLLWKQQEQADREFLAAVREVLVKGGKWFLAV